MNKYDEKYSECPVCHSKKIVDYHADFRGNSISKCHHCTIQFMNPVYSDEYLDDFYSNYIADEYTDKLVKHQKYVINDNFMAVDKQVKEKGLFLDFGVGDGTHAYFAANNGWQVEGYDVDCKVMADLKEKFELNTYCGDFFKEPFKKGSYKLIYANQVIEHLKDPVKYLDYFQSLLADNGKLFISVPNIRSTSSKIKFFLERIGLRKKNIGKYYDSDHHIFYYEPSSIKKLLELNGYKVEYLRNCSKPIGSRSKFSYITHKYIVEKLFSTATFLLIASKK